MIVDVIFEENESSFDVDFGEVYNISDGGFERGYEQGYANGYALGDAEGTSKGYRDGYSEGAKTEYDKFWDAYQENGNRTDYQHTFRTSAWTDDSFKPKYDMQPTLAGNMFLKTSIRKSEQLKRVDFSKCQDVVQTFAQSLIEELPLLDFSNVNKGYGGINQTFYHMLELRRIEKIIMPTYNYTSGYGEKGLSFGPCPKLEEVRVEGTIQGKSNMSGCPLSVASMKSVILALENLTGTANEFVFTLSFDDDAWSRLEADGTTAPDGNSWREYVESTLCWLT